MNHCPANHLIPLRRSTTFGRVSNHPIDYEFTIPGAILMDGILHSFCLGFVLALGLKYWEEYAEDSMRKRVFVLTIVLLSFLQTVLEDYKLWMVAVFRRGSWAGTPLVWTDFFLNGIISAMCEAFYIRRCWKMTGKSRWVLYPMALLWINVVGAQLYINITLGLDATFDPSTYATILIYLDAVLDMTVAAILITSLVKSKTGLEASNSVVHRVILLTLETALLPSIAMVIAVIILHVVHHGHHNDLVLFFIFMTAKLYAIGLLRTLNARAKLRERIDSTDLGRTTLGTWSWDQDHPQMQEGGGRAGVKLDDGPGLTMSPTDTSRAENIAVAPDEMVGMADSQRVHFGGSPMLEQHERGYARLRVSSVHRPRPLQTMID
ncbi:hypothetical protein C8R46DRAFT_1093376 [Mycena filopes]|nr:hypothetical protein C8R46DRAFT_1093376 [Mycena filopes]